MTNIGSQLSTESWRDVALRKRELQSAALVSNLPFSDNQTSKTIEDGKGSYTALKNPEEVAALIQNGEATCVAITEAFIQRARESHDLTNCLTEVLFEEALRDAARLDAYYSTHNALVGPLHGVVVTLKDQFDVKGYDSTIGYISRCFKPALEDATLVKILRSLGAIVIAKSNLPQSVLWCETENPLWGLTTNPKHRGYTPGGSTGGEVVLLASEASMLGWGTDVGGSIRVPCHMMGIYGLSPSSARLPYKGVPVSHEGQEHNPSSVGPLARSLNMIHLSTKAVIDAQPWGLDARCISIPWREETYQAVQSRPLTIGVLVDSGVIRPHPPLTRVLYTATESLRAAGHEILEWNPDLHDECIELIGKYNSADGGQDIREAVEAGGEPYMPNIERLVSSAEPISVYDYWQLNRKKWALQQKYLEKWDSLRSPVTGRVADAVLMLTMPHTSVPHRSCRWVGCTNVWNLLDYPALVIPGGSVCREDLEQPWGFEARNERDDFIGKVWEKHGQEMVDLNLPIGLQLICRKLEEEKLLGIGKVLDDLLSSKFS